MMSAPSLRTLMRLRLAFRWGKQAVGAFPPALLTVDQEVGGSSPPSCTSEASAIFDD
jgi:hypothetical protein